MSLYYDIILMSGIRKLDNREIRQMNRGFYGGGFPHPGVECFIEQINKLLTHYGCRSGMGVHMQATTELMITKGGISTQIISEPYPCFSKWITHSWLKSVWEKINLFQL
jgi:hypothetical protein